MCSVGSCAGPGRLERCQLHPPTVGHLCCNFIGTQLQQWDTITAMGRQFITVIVQEMKAR